MELITQGKKKLIRRHNGRKANKNACNSSSAHQYPFGA